MARDNALHKRDYRLVTGGTDSHLMIIDLRNKDITGKTAEQALEKAGITTSRSCIPFDMEKPWITSGLRLGTPAITARGMKEEHMETIAELIDTVIEHHTKEDVYRYTQERVQELCKLFPITQ